MNRIDILTQIYAALDTLVLKGYENCKTYSNCMDALASIISEMKNDDKKNDNKKEE